jgi:hypothetical protein
LDAYCCILRACCLLLPTAAYCCLLLPTAFGTARAPYCNHCNHCNYESIMIMNFPPFTPHSLPHSLSLSTIVCTPIHCPIYCAVHVPCTAVQLPYSLSGSDLVSLLTVYCKGPTVLLSCSYCPTVLLSYWSNIPLCYYPTILLSHCPAILLSHCPTIPVLLARLPSLSEFGQPCFAASLSNFSKAALDCTLLHCPTLANALLHCLIS